MGVFLCAVSHKSSVPYQLLPEASRTACSSQDWGHCVRQAWVSFSKTFSLWQNCLVSPPFLRCGLSPDLVTIIILCSFGKLLYVWFSNLYHYQKKFLVLQPIYTHRKIIKAPLLHQSLGPRVFLSFSLSLPPFGSLSFTFLSSTPDHQVLVH